MKKLLFLALSILFTFALCACGNPAPTPSAAPTDNGPPASVPSLPEAADPATEGWAKTQAVTVDMFGTPVDTVLLADEGLTKWRIDYVAIGNQPITAYGTFNEDGGLVLDEDPTGFVIEVVMRASDLIDSNGWAPIS